MKFSGGTCNLFCSRGWQRFRYDNAYILSLENIFRTSLWQRLYLPGVTLISSGYHCGNAYISYISMWQRSYLPDVTLISSGYKYDNAYVLQIYDAYIFHISVSQYIFMISVWQRLYFPDMRALIFIYEWDEKNIWVRW